MVVSSLLTSAYRIYLFADTMKTWMEKPRQTPRLTFSDSGATGSYFSKGNRLYHFVEFIQASSQMIH